MDQLRRLIRCPVCMETPRPGPRNDIGVCRAGHPVCFNCSLELLKNKTECPLCRDPNFSVTTSHYLANGLLSIVAEGTIYGCKHPTCAFECNGLEICQHEQHCVWKPLGCPKEKCKKKLPLAQMTDPEYHPCILRAPYYRLSCWKLTIPIEYFFNLDHYACMVSPMFKPILLSSSDNPDHCPRAYLNIKVFSKQSIMIFVGFLNPRSDTVAPEKDLIWHLSASIYTGAGKIGYVHETPMLYEDEKPTSITQGIYLHQDMITRWMRWQSEDRCYKCPDNPQPHCHIKVHL
jgi:Zinc finger, C3HC4 type (RING finger)